MVLARVATSAPVPAVVLIDGAADGASALVMALNSPDVAPKLVGRTDALDILGRAPSAPPKPAAAPYKAGSPGAAPRLLGAHR